MDWGVPDFEIMGLLISLEAAPLEVLILEARSSTESRPTSEHPCPAAPFFVGVCVVHSRLQSLASFLLGLLNGILVRDANDF